MARLTLVAGVLAVACGVLPACTDDAPTVTVAQQDTTPPQFVALVGIENAKQLVPPTTAPPTTAGTTPTPPPHGFAATISPGMTPPPSFTVASPGDNLAIVVNASDYESGVQRIQIDTGKGTQSCGFDGDDGSTSGPGLRPPPPVPGKNSNVSPGDEVPRDKLGSSTIPVRPADLLEVTIRAVDNYGNVSRAHFSLAVCKP
jgi:hypothetical protein